MGKNCMEKNSRARFLLVILFIKIHSYLLTKKDRVSTALTQITDSRAYHNPWTTKQLFFSFSFPSLKEPGPVKITRTDIEDITRLPGTIRRLEYDEFGLVILVVINRLTPIHFENKKTASYPPIIYKWIKADFSLPQQMLQNEKNERKMAHSKSDTTLTHRENMGQSKLKWTISLTEKE